MRQFVEIAKKLELTSIALGCLTRKELCAAFARVNPNTAMTLQNSYNWRSGRSVPRTFSLFEDWAAAVGVEEGPHFVMSSSLNEFVRVLGDKFALPDELLEAFGGPMSGGAAAPLPADEGDTVAWGKGSLLRGSFLGLSPSWSPIQRGRLLCGVATFEIADGCVSASYRENVLGRTIVFTGSGMTDGRSCQVNLRCEANGGAYFMAFHLPSLPGNLAGGIFAGTALYDPNSEPTASALLLVRNHGAPLSDLDSILDYLDADESALAVCFDRLGYGRDPAFAAEREILRLLVGGDDPSMVLVPRDRFGRAAMLLDRRQLEASGPS